MPAGGVQAFEVRFVLGENDGDDGFEILLVRQVDPGSTVWWSLEPEKGEFLRFDLRRSSKIKTESGKDPGTFFKPIARPSAEEREAILEALDQQLGVPRSGRPLTPRPSNETRGRPDDRRVGFEEPEWRPRRPQNPRRTWNQRGRRMVQRAREAGPGQVIAGGAVTSGLAFKLYANLTLVFGRFATVFFRADGSKTVVLQRLEAWFGDYKQAAERIETLSGFLASSGVSCWENWDTVLLCLAGLWLAYRIFFGPSDAAYQVSRQREEDEARARRLESLLQKQHEERQRPAPRVSEGSGVSGRDAMKDKVDDYEELIKRDRGQATKPREASTTAFSRVSDTVARLTQRALNPLTLVITRLGKMREIKPWNFAVGFRTRLAGDFASLVHKDGKLARDFSRQYRRDHHLEGCQAFNAFDAVCDISDAFHMDDSWFEELYNTHGYERLARWGVGFLEVFKEVEKEEHWKGDKSKLRTRWGRLSKFHLTEARLNDLENPESTAEVQEEMQKTATFNKWLTKSGGATAVDGSATGG